MSAFMIRFLISNLFISVILLFLFLIRRLFQHTLTSRMQYRLWYIMIGLWSVPFLPFPVTGFLQPFSWVRGLKEIISFQTINFAGNAITPHTAKAMEPIQDFALSVSRETPSVIEIVLSVIWLAGILVMLLLVLRSQRQFYRIRQSALPLQNREVRILYRNCLNTLKITTDIPVYSTAFLKSPVMTGIFHPCIYLPIHVISDSRPYELRYILLHELQHFRHKDAFTGCLMDLFGMLYWFNPLIWHALREMRSDRETACDAAVLDLLDENDYENYGHTLLGLAEKISFTPFPFAVGISGSMKQMQKRIIQIATYKKPSAQSRAKGNVSFCLIAVVFLGLAPMLSTYAADQNSYKWDSSSKTISMVDLSSYFKEYDGTFVLYDLTGDKWTIHNMEHAVLRVAPDSTYKIYDALFGLEERIITPRNSFMAWDGSDYPFEAWNTDQNLYSAMSASVNWYFQRIDEQLGRAAVNRCIQEIGYGNQDIRSDFSSYWIQSSLKISSIEQVELLTDLYRNRFDFSWENVEEVKKSICLFSSENQSFYGKTGTGRTEGQDVNGWFIGFIEAGENAFFFATNIQKDTGATGSRAAEITMSILSHMNLWN